MTRNPKARLFRGERRRAARGCRASVADAWSRSRRSRSVSMPLETHIEKVDAKAEQALGQGGSGLSRFRDRRAARRRAARTADAIFQKSVHK